MARDDVAGQTRPEGWAGVGRGAPGARAPWRTAALLVAAAATLTACGGKSDGGGSASASASGAAAGASAAPHAGANASGRTAARSNKPLLVAPEDLLAVQPAARALGPLVTGTLQPERRADLRAEVPAVVLNVLRDNGEPVRRGDLLVQLDATTLRDNLLSAQEAARAAGQQVEQAERQLQRLRTLQAQGMTSMQALEDAEIRRNAAQSEMIAARARVAAAQQQMARTEVRAPFDGVVIDRRASAGDTAQVGKELLKVIDPRSMRLDGLVSADRMHEVKVGQAVSFRVNGVPGRQFDGVVERVDAAANAVTRQLAVQVAFRSADVPRVAGLYAEGRIASATEQVLMLPEAALQRAGDTAVAWRVRENRLERAVLTLGERDERSGLLVVRSGLAAGEQVLRRPGSGLVDGQAVERVASLVPAPGPGGSAPSTTASR